MVVETSALVAILLDEPEAQTLWRIIAGSPERLLSAVSLVEANLVLSSRLSPEGETRIDDLLVVLAIEVVPFTPEQARVACSATARAAILPP